jgi:heme exporter protein C
MQALFRLSAIAGWLTLPVTLAAIAAVFLYAPTEAVQGPVQRIFYFHVSLAWVAYLAFFVVFVSSVVYLLRRNPRWDVVARSSAEVGVIMTTLVLVTGSLWARPIWGTWWSWDARLTTTLVLWFLYVAYLMVRSYASGDRAPRYAAILGIVGFLDVPIVHFSVVWWRTLHPGRTVIQESGSIGMPPEMFAALLVSLLAFTLLYVFLLGQKAQIEHNRDRLQEVLRQQAL